MAIVEPVSTRTLLRQQCHLITYDRQSARVGIASQPLFKMMQSRMPNVEAAFRRYAQQPVTVTLEINTPPASASSETQPVPAPPPPPQSSPPPMPIAEEPPPVEQAPYMPSPLSVSPPPEVSPPPQWQPDDDVTRAAKSFAEMFNGQIIDPDDDETTASTPIATESGLQLDPLSEPSSELDEDDDDVPF